METDMNEQRERKNRNWKPLLLIPAAVIVAKTALHHRLRWESAGGPDGPHHRHGRHGFGRRGWMAEDGSLRLPPKIEAMLETWHARAHEQRDATPSTTV